MGGKSSTSQQTVSIPPEVLARYNAVNARAEQAASQQFQQYSSRPEDFVAQLNPVQQQGIAQTQAASQQAQPYYGAAGEQLMRSQAQYQPYLGASTQQLLGAQAGTQPYFGASTEQLLGAQQAAQPFMAAATGFGLAGAQGVSPGALQTQQYLNPYLGTVLGAQSALLNQQQQQQMAGQLGNAIQAGAFGGDRAGIAAANLAQQQQLASQKIYSDILNQGYQQALQTAQQQQGVQLGAEQANRAALQQAAQQMAALGQQGYGMGAQTAQQLAALGQQQFGMGTQAAQQLAGLGQQQFGMGAQTAQQLAALGQQGYGMGAQTAQQLAGLGAQQYGIGSQTAQQLAALGQQGYGIGSQTAQQLAGLGAGAQAAGLQGAQAVLGAGQLGQQTEQAGKTALYNQFLQQQSYPFQVAQFLANIAEGTGSLSGSTTTTTQPGGFFSDERLKENIEEVGRTHDGQPIYKYNYKHGDKRTQIGLLAQDVEKHHPEAVGLAGGYKTVDYDKATQDSSMGGSVNPSDVRMGFADGGYPDFAALLAQQAGMYEKAPWASAMGAGLAGAANPRGGMGYVPQASLSVGKLQTAGELPKQTSALEHMNQMAQLGVNLEKGWQASEGLRGAVKDTYENWKNPPAVETSGGESFTGGTYTPKNEDELKQIEEMQNIYAQRYSGGVAGYAAGGMPYEADAPAGGTNPMKLNPNATSFLGAHMAEGGLADETPENKTKLDIPDDPDRHQLAVAGSAPKGRSTMEDIQAMAQIAAMFAAAGAAHGGRMGYAGGGTPYGDQGLGLDIPDEQNQPRSLQQPGALQKNPTGLQNTANLAQIGAGGTLMAQGLGGGAAGAGAAGAGAAGAEAAGAAGAGAAGSGMMAALGPIGLGALGVLGLSELFKARGGVAGGRHGYAVGGMPFDRRDPNDPLQNPLPTSGEGVAPPLTDAELKRGVELEDIERKVNQNIDPRLVSTAGAAGLAGPAILRAANPYYNVWSTKSSETGKTPEEELAALRAKRDARQNWEANQTRLLSQDLQRESAARTLGLNDPARQSVVPRAQAAPAAAPARPAAPRPGVAPPPAYTADEAAAAAAAENPDEYARLMGQPRGVDYEGLAAQAESRLGRSPVDTATPAGLLPTTAPNIPKPIGERVKELLANTGLNKSENVIPLLTGLAAMGTAPTRSLGVAAASGVGAGAQAYLPVQKAKAEIEKTQAETGFRQALTGAQQVVSMTELMSAAKVKGLAPRPDPNGNFLVPNGRGGFDHYTLSSPFGTSDQGTTQGQPYQYKHLGKAGQDFAKNAYAEWTALENPENNEKEIRNTISSGVNARNSLVGLHDTEKAFSNLASGKGGLGSVKGGALAQFTQPVGRYIEGIIRQVPGFENYKYTNLADAQIATKSAIQMAGERVSGQGQRALGALDLTLSGIPNVEMTPEAAIKILSGIHANTLREGDLGNYFDEMGRASKQASQSNNPYAFNASSALSRFAEDKGVGYYENVKNNIEKLIRENKNFTGIMRDLQSGNPEAIKKAITYLDRFGGAGFHRAFTGSLQ